MLCHCDGGTQTRSRQFLVSAQYGGKACVGDTVQTAACSSQPCPEVDSGGWNGTSYEYN